MLDGGLTKVAAVHLCGLLQWQRVADGMNGKITTAPECIFKACFVLPHLQPVQAHDVKPAGHFHAAIQSDWPLSAAECQYREVGHPQVV